MLLCDKVRHLLVSKCCPGHIFLISALFYLTSISLSLSIFLPSFLLIPSLALSPSHCLTWFILTSHYRPKYYLFPNYLSTSFDPSLSFSLSLTFWFSLLHFTSLLFLFLTCTIFIPPHLIPVSYLLFPSSPHFFSKFTLSNNFLFPSQFPSYRDCPSRSISRTSRAILCTEFKNLQSVSP